MRILSGIKPTGDFHIGNYLGALKKWVELQEDKKNSCLFFIADYHSLTADFVDPKEKSRLIEELALNFLAIGLDPEKSILFIQSQVPECAELNWIFSCLTPMGELERMTQYKDKVVKKEKNINAGLFTYPVLMAADVLLYRADAVPVGDDQLQHIELTRETARRFNRRYGEFFKEPKDITTSMTRLMSLKDPLKKMSKSEPNSYIGVFDEPDEIRKKIKGAVSGDNSIFEEIGINPIENKLNFNFKLSDKKKDFAESKIETMMAGIENLLGLLKEFNSPKFNDIFNSNGIADFEKLKYGQIKEDLAEGMIDYFAPMRKKREELEKNKDEVMKIYQDGADKTRAIAQETMREVKKLIGLPTT